MSKDKQKKDSDSKKKDVSSNKKERGSSEQYRTSHTGSKDKDMERSTGDRANR